MHPASVYRYPMALSGVDARLDMLADGRRRRVLEYLRRGRRHHATVGELAEHLARRADAGTDRQRRDGQRLRVALVHRTLPKLAANDVVDWDRRRDEVRYREDEVVESVLDVLPEDSMTVEG